MKLSPQLYERLMKFHHVGVAIVVALAILIIEHAGALNWLENLTLRVAASMQGDVATSQKKDPADAVVLTISTEIYETAFGQASPLDRTKLAAMLGKLANEKPRMLVIDLDLSPEGPGQAMLDEALLKMAQQGTQLLLATPFPVYSETLFQAKFAWMQQLCGKKNIRFADTRLPVTQGVNLRYFTGRNALGDIAHAWKDDSAPPAEQWPCDGVLIGENRAGFLDANMQQDEIETRLSSQYPDQVHLDPATLRRTLATVRDIEKDTGGVLSAPAALGLAGRTVFLGGDYSGADRFQTIARSTPVPGVVVHAAAYNGARLNLERITPLEAIAVDILIGTLAGLMFHFTWGRHNGSQHRLAAAGRQGWSLYLTARLWLAVNFILLALFIWAILQSASWLLDRHLWSNPAPMVLGIFIKSLLGSRSHLLPEDRHAAHNAESTHSHHPPAWIVGSDLILVAVLLIVLNLMLGHH
jgi:CHASE2 domain-containing sensor protein